MRTFRLIAVNFIFVAIFAISAFAQAADGRIGLVNTYAFEDDKAGITKLVAASSSLEKEFAPSTTELEKMYNAIQAAQKELQAMQLQVNDPKYPGDKAKLQITMQTKAADYDKMGREFKFKQDDLKARVDARRAIVVGPIYQDVMKALQDFAVKNNYAVILDGAKLEEAQILMAFNKKYDVTTEFIAFYNTRPAGTAAAVPVK